VTRQLGDQIETSASPALGESADSAVNDVSGGEATTLGSIFSVGAALAWSAIPRRSVSEKEGRPGMVGARELASLASPRG